MTSSNSTPSSPAHASPATPSRWPWLIGPLLTACMVIYPVVVYAITDGSDGKGLLLTTVAVALAGTAMPVLATLMRHHETDRYHRRRRDVERQLLQHQVTGHTTAIQQMSSWRQHIDTEVARLNGYLEGSAAAASGTGDLARYVSRADDYLAAIAGHLEQLTHLQPAASSSGADTGRQAAGDEPDQEVLVYVGHRVHSLVSRMLERLKATEREQEDPDLLDDLYRIDHLATQLRRAAERLAVLGGHTARRAHSPVPISTVLRQAVAEVEDYSRIQLTLPDDDPNVPGYAGPDVIHVVAELLENATKFSRPDTTVMMSTISTPGGLGIEIRDEGLPLTAQKLEDLQRILATPHQVSPREQVRQGQIGMLVAARLATRHHLLIELHPDTHGTRALVVLPHTLLTAPVPDAPAASAPELPHRRAAIPAASPAGRPAAAAAGAVPNGTVFDTSGLNGSGVAVAADTPSAPPPNASSASTGPTTPSPGRRPALPRRSQAAASQPPPPRPASPPPEPGQPPTPGLMSAFTAGFRSAQRHPQQDYTGPDPTGQDRPHDPATG